MPKTKTSAPDAGEPNRSFMTLRSAVLLLLAVITGFGAGYLTYAEHHRVADGLLVGFAAAGTALWWFDRFIS